MVQENPKSGVRVKKQGRIARRKRDTRARLLEAGHDIMAEVGVDAAKIQDITDRADVGFGTFYNYFESKDAIAKEILDCMMHDLGMRNIAATKKLAISDPAAVMPLSTRLFINEAVKTPIWGWWALRSDLLVNRVREGFAPFATRDMKVGIDSGFLRMQYDQVDQAWALACWMLVGGIHDIVVGDRPPESERFVSYAIMRAWGYDLATARRVTDLSLPKQKAPKIDWTFRLSESDGDDMSFELEN